MTVDGTGTIRPGDWVRCERDTPAVGTWARYAGRVGRVVTINRPDREYGVRFTAGQNEAPSWFRADELVKVTRPQGSPSITTATERARTAETRSRCSDSAPAREAAS